MAMKWTDDQQKVISLRNRNILVSAGAGSGKTAVLVQRILSKIMDPKKPVDIDRMLIMTFTRAAAGEMRERILAALEQALYENPDDEHLQRQMMLIHTAQITTIDGFCSYIIKNYFHMINLDPGYRTADEGELKLLKEDVLKELIEESYAKGHPDFINFVECYATGKSDDDLHGMILKIYDAAMSHPKPDEWLSSCLDIYRVANADEMKSQTWYGILWETVIQELEAAKVLIDEAMEICQEADGPQFYEEALICDQELLRDLKKNAEEFSYEKMYARLSNIAFAKLSAKRDPSASAEKKEKVKELREQYKGIIKELSEKYFSQSEDNLISSIQRCVPVMRKLIELVFSFKERFADKKREKNLLDFTDMEHLALKILIMQGENGEEMSQAARELSEKYDEVLVDEYQDSNLVQELLTNCVSGWVNDRKNIFMVGDVKQSIYRFRLARPELFMEKYRTYTLEDSKEQRIDLHKNFRSRKEVLDCVNFIFRRIMGEDLGGITYDESEELNAGMEYPDGCNPESVKTEILLIDKDSGEVWQKSKRHNPKENVTEKSAVSAENSVEAELTASMEEQAEQNAVEMEALTISHSIKNIVGKQQVWDKHTGEYRPAEYGDIAILLRTASGWAETFLHVLSSKDIPAYTASKTGYFSALEVVTVLNYLRICDNPLQDIPMAGILRSPIVECTAQELALIKCIQPEGYLYESLCSVVEGEEIPDVVRELISRRENNMEQQWDVSMDSEFSENEFMNNKYMADKFVKRISMKSEEMDEKINDVTIECYKRLRRKLSDFLDVLKNIRKLSAYTPIHQLIQIVLNETGYGDFARAMPGGAQRSANLHMLVEKAMDYEKTSYRGLFNFVRYIENLQKYEVDFGEVNLSGGTAASVQIMTIHKSKGLEFPIVYVAGMGKQFNFQDMNAKLLVHPELGIGADVILPEKRQIIPGLLKQMIRRQLLKESLGEELRVLYVALTRAREKLFITGTIGKLAKHLAEILHFRGRKEELLPVWTRMEARTFWDYILAALADHPCMEDLFGEYQLDYWKEKSVSGEPAEFKVTRITAEDLVLWEVNGQTENEMEEDYLKNWDSEQIYDAEIHKILKERFSYTYPYEYLKDIPVKVSVSELKKRSYKGPDEKEDALFFEPDIVPLIPSFISKETENYQGAARGTAYHRLMECLDYHRVDTREQIKQQIQELVDCQKMEKAESECISVRDIQKFVENPLGIRMGMAARENRLYREQPFVLSVNATELDLKWNNGEQILVQGIIDAFFIEDGEIVLVDYKTDKVRRGEEQKLIDLYHVQLEDYAQALERMLGMKVKEKYIYSFTLNKAILL